MADDKQLPALTPKQEAFCRHYIVDMNATQAAIHAGYSKSSAAVAGSDNLRKPNIVAAIKMLKAERVERVTVTADEVVRELASVALIPVDDPRLVEGPVKPADKLKALDLLGKHLGMFKEIKEISGPDGGPIEIANATLRREVAQFLEPLEPKRIGMDPEPGGEE